MKTRYVDITTLMTVRNYSLKIGKTTQLIYTHLREGKLKGIDIDGVKFVVVKQKMKTTKPAKGWKVPVD